MNWDILLKYINKETSPAEDQAINDWLNEQAENKYLLDYLRRRGDEAKNALPTREVQIEWDSLLNRILDAEPLTNVKPIRSNKYRYMAIAASLLLVSAFGLLYLKSNKQTAKQQQFTVKTPVNLRGKATLPDGTLVYMAPNSTIKYDNSYGVNKRTVQLSGEAFFDVKHLTKKPFIIHAQNGVDLTVLGTSFNFYSRKNEIAEIKVANGLVGITADKHTHFLKAGEQLNYQVSNHHVDMQKVEQPDATSLQNETLYFKNNTAEEIAIKLQRWYNIKVETLPSAKQHPRFSGEMKDTGLDNLLKGLSYATGIKYRYQDFQTILLF
ncbi:FecR family protein [Mucilaginibacter jinjuensis]|uniref:FecR family protein n=1 Tax=Mucilaginibacter jinjuensis TaxID=1176721 RepID=A0ABY7T1F8_9SPHI|nr:FecR family protein [Mucilaginibacter jinjuensis]WCT10166.1 FecR family protein [Mucilaginibacter jinjuensis]